ncbi:hypothetical protein AMATHDRAFT_5789 [Amanita thiersii Skay4041]|uniref:AB hydrolase-1 domain-containing protein n=1 Tax=Amanita thiersii Skay4041 TaxID=703135 RepID=A0A2A9NJH7_9AGAR|nr:hypothetical protein AMATHDRAFT_5789 [Amanita thiersii Skay4041]
MASNWRLKSLSRLLSPIMTPFTSSFKRLSFLLSIAWTVLAQGNSLMNCSEAIIPIGVIATVADFKLSPPKSQSELTGLVTRLASQNSNVTVEIGTSTYQLNKSYDIWSKLCVPVHFKRGTLEFAIHGINFDHSYWDFGGEGSQYNYVEAAVNAGHAIFIYDRLGTGQSSKPDGIKEAQKPTEVAIAAQLLKLLKQGIQGFVFDKVVAIGHSYGSSQVTGLAADYPSLVDAIVLTGFSAYSGGLSATFSAFGLTIAANQNRTRWGSLPSSYVVTEGMYNDEMNFFRYPFFEAGVLQHASDSKGLFTLGQILTQAPSPTGPFNKPILVVTGDKDFIFCAGDCYQNTGKGSNLIDETKTLFPAGQYSYYIPAETGHAVNLHFSAKESYEVIQKWMVQRQM